MGLVEPLPSQERENFENFERPGSPIEPPSSRISPEKIFPIVEEPLQEEASIGVTSQSLMKTRVVARREKGKGKQIDTEKKEEKSKSGDSTSLVAKKRKVTKMVSLATTKVAEELAIGSSPATTKEKSQRRSDKL